MYWINKSIHLPGRLNRRSLILLAMPGHRIITMAAGNDAGDCFNICKSFYAPSSKDKTSSPSQLKLQVWCHPQAAVRLGVSARPSKQRLTVAPTRKDRDFYFRALARMSSSDFITPKRFPVHLRVPKAA